MYFNLLPVLLALLAFSFLGEGSTKGLDGRAKTNLSEGQPCEYCFRSLNSSERVSNASGELLESHRVARRLRRDAPPEGAASRDKREGMQTIVINIEAEDENSEPNTYNYEAGDGAAAPSGAEIDEEGDEYPLNRAEGLLDVHVRPVVASGSSKRDVQVFVDAGPDDVVEGVEYEDSERQDLNTRTKRLTPTHKDEAPPLTDTVPWMQEPSSGGQRVRPSQSDQGPHQVVEIGSAFEKFHVKVPVKTDGQGHQGTGYQRPPNGGRPQVIQGTPRPHQKHMHKIQVQVKPIHRPQTQASGVVSSGGQSRNPQQRPPPRTHQTPPRKPIIVPQPRPPPRPPIRVPQRPKAPLQGPPNPKIYMPRPQPPLSEGGSEVKITVDEVPVEGSLETTDNQETPLLPQYPDQVPLVPGPPGGPSTSFVDYETYPTDTDPQVYGQVYPLETPDYALPQQPQAQEPLQYPQYPSYDYREVPPGPPPSQAYPDYQLPSKPSYHPKPSGSKLACNTEYDWGCYSASNTFAFSSYFVISACVSHMILPLLFHELACFVAVICPQFLV